jgi:demethylspheroidene O-methyltransferase
MIEHHAALYADLADPVALLRGSGSGSQLANYWPYAANQARSHLDDQRVAQYSALMSASQPLVADEILDAYDLNQHRCLLDIGGGEGRFLCTAAACAPHLQLMLFDLPAVAERARSKLASQGLAQRAQIYGGDFYTDALPQGADIVSLIRVIQDHDDAAALLLLRSARKALPSGGVLLLAEPMASTAGAERMGDAYFGFYLLAMGSGRPRSAQQLGELLTQAGFGQWRLVPTRMPLQTQLIVARAI